MKNLTTLSMIAAAVFAVSGCGSKSKPADTTTTDTTQAATNDPAHDPAKIQEAQAQVADLKKMCEGAADAMKQRQAAKPLYARLGGRDAIKAVVTDVIELKATNDIMKPTMTGVDKAKFIENLTDFLAMGTGGPEKYKGGDLTTVHAKMKLTDVHFMAAGAAVLEVLAKYKVPEPETQEVVCALVAAHDMVVIPTTASAQ